MVKIRQMVFELFKSERKTWWPKKGKEDVDLGHRILEMPNINKALKWMLFWKRKGY